MKADKVNVLGTEYTIETHKVSEDNKLKENHWAGYCGEESKKIIIAAMTERPYFQLDEHDQDAYGKTTLRHEIIHAFLNESGLSDSTMSHENWARNEEMIDWIAIQFPKITKAFEEAGCLS